MAHPGFERLHALLPLGSWINAAVAWLLERSGGLFDLAGRAIDSLAGAIEMTLQAVPAWLLIGMVGALAWRRLSWRFAAFSTLALLLIGVLGYWPQTIVTLGLTVSATLMSLVWACHWAYLPRATATCTRRCARCSISCRPCQRLST